MKLKHKLIAAFAAMSPALAFADGEAYPGESVMTSVSGSMTSLITALVAVVGTVAVAGLALWAAPYIIRRLKRAVSSAG